MHVFDLSLLVFEGCLITDENVFSAFANGVFG